MISLKLSWILTFSTVYFLISELLFCLVSGQAVREDVRTHPNWRLLNNGEHCGLSSNDRIIGGKQASLGQYPWIARIGYAALREDKNYSQVFYTCGGTLINDRYVLTAAHCAPKHNFPDWLRMDMVQVRLGEHDAASNPDCQHGRCAPPALDVDIQQYSCHPGYERDQQHDDICLLRLATPVPFGRYVHSICLPVFEWFQNKTLEDKVMEVAGWGISDLARPVTSDVLMTVPVPVVGQFQCQMHFKNDSVISQKQVCAGGVVGQDSCTGDSGGPLMAALAVDAPPRYFLMGIVSFGDSKCGETQTPGVYTRTTEYLTWILDHMTD